MLHHIGDASFLKNLEATRAGSRARQRLESFLRVWHERLGETDYTIRELAARLDADNVECEQALRRRCPGALRSDRIGQPPQARVGPQEDGGRPLRNRLLHLETPAKTATLRPQSGGSWPTDEHPQDTTKPRNNHAE